MEYPYHPLANLFPLIEGKDFDEFCAGLRADGRLHDRIVLFEGMILDGRNRQRACDATGVTAHYRQFNPEIEGDALKFVISKNLHRRHLTPSQRAMLAADIATMRQGERTDLQPSANLQKVARSDAADIAGVSERSVASAAEVKERGTPELQDAVRQDKVAVSTAAEIATLPGPEQTKVLALSDKEIVARARAIRDAKQAEKKARRAEREADLAAKQTALPDKRYGVILADPEWRFEPYSRETGMDRAADNHYPTSDVADISTRPVATIAAEDCVLFLWATVPMLPQALAVMAAWGFEYRSHVAWLKPSPGTGYWFRNQHELLLVGVRGKPPAPAPGTQFRSALAADNGAHSEKPAFAHEIAEAYFPNLPKIELNARRARSGWDAWGLEAPAAEPGEAAPSLPAHDPKTGEVEDTNEAPAPPEESASNEGGDHVEDPATLTATHAGTGESNPVPAVADNVVPPPKERPAFAEEEGDDPLAIPAALLRVQLNKREATMLARVRLEDCDADERILIGRMRRDLTSITAADRDDLVAIARAQGLHEDAM